MSVVRPTAVVYARPWTVVVWSVRWATHSAVSMIESLVISLRSEKKTVPMSKLYERRNPNIEKDGYMEFEGDHLRADEQFYLESQRVGDKSAGKNVFGRGLLLTIFSKR